MTEDEGSLAHGIEDPADVRLDPLRAVRDPARIRREGRFVAEGRRAVRTLLRAAPALVEVLLLTPAARTALGDVLEARGDARILEVRDERVLAAATGARFHHGCLALARLPRVRPVEEIERALGPGARCWIVLDRVTDPDNVGAIFRSATALGAQAVLLSPGSAHPLYRKALRTSNGTALVLPFAEAQRWPQDLEFLRQEGIALVALTPGPGAVPLEATTLRLGERIALAVGSEECGMAAEVLALADHRLRIPMAAHVDSLNVAATVAIALHALVPEALRPRR